MAGGYVRACACGSARPRLTALVRVAGAAAIVAASVGLVGCTSRGPDAGRPGDFVELIVNGERLVVEVASDEPSRNLGLMHRESLPENHGMLFIHPRPRHLAFWMRNTLIPLSIAFLGDDGTIHQIEDMQPKDESRTVSKKSVRLALEVNQGWFQRHGIAVGDVFSDFSQKVSRFRGR